MEINQALTTAKKLKNHFQAFEHLDRFLQEVASLQASHSQMLSDHESLKVQKHTLEDTIENLKDEVATLVGERDDLERKNKEQKDDLDILYENGLKENEERVEKELEGLKAEIATTQQLFNEQRSEMTVAIENLQAQKEEAEENFRLASDRLQQLKDSL